MAHMTSSQRPGRFDVQSDWNERELVKTIPGAKWDAERKLWHIPQTWPACLQMRGTFGQRLTISDEVREWASARKLEVDAAVAWHSVIDPGIEVDGLYPWQVADYYWASAAGTGMLLGNDQGTGKTASAQTVVRGLADGLPALVICPNSVKRVWENEAKRWVPEANVYVIGGGAVQRKKIIDQALADPKALVVINYEGLKTHSRLAPYGSVRLKRCKECGGDDNPVVKPAQCHVHKKELNDTNWIRTIVIDEAHRLKDPKSQQTRAVWAVCHDPSVVRRIAMTGTPIANHIGDLWAIMHAIARDEYPVRSHFLDRYAQMSWNAFGGLDVVGLRQDTAAEFYAFFDSRYRRVTKAAAAPWLPDKIRSVRYAEMSTKMKKAYKELDDQMVTRFEDGTIAFATNSLTQTTRLLQLASSYGTTEADGSYKMCEPSPKLDVLDEILEETGDRPICVCALSKQLINLAAVRLEKRGVPFGLITGDVHEIERRRTLDAFQAGRLKALMFTLGAGGEGLTMTAADTIVFLQRSWSVVQNLQAEDRVHRIGSEIHEVINIIDVVMPDTIEEDQIVKVYAKLRRLEEVRRDGLEFTGSDSIWD